MRRWAKYRHAQLQAEYQRRRDYYHERALELGLAYNDSAVAARVQQRLTRRGYTPPRKAIGDIHTFACIPQFSWHEHLLPDLRQLGDVTLFDYNALGFSYSEFISGTRRGVARRNEMADLILPALRRAHQKRPVDWVFCYGGGQDTSPAVIRRITEELGIPCVNMSLDDKQGWAGAQVGECRVGAIDITAAFDLYITSARVACEWHLVEGGEPVYMPEGFNANAFYPTHVKQDIQVSFVGGSYGYRTDVIENLRRHGIQVSTFGSGWSSASWVSNIADVFNRSVVNLGMGGIEFSEYLTNVKGRDFEVPGTGGGVYLTSFNPDLAQHFVVGEEILCYGNREEMLELIRRCLREPEYARAIALRARERSLREHRWFHRYVKSLQLLGVVRDDDT
jgi:glycosyl transferase family 1